MTVTAPLPRSPALSPAGAGASLTGREHVRLGRNNQDGFALARRGQAIAGVVTDGCSSSPRSEVGAQLSARFLAGWVATHAAGAPLTEELGRIATDALCAWIYRAVSTLDGPPTAFVELVETYFLHTFLCGVQIAGDALVFGIGDGAVLVDDALTRLDAGPRNAPPYAAYRLLTGRRPEPQVHFLGRARRVVLMTDGFDALLEKEPSRLAALLDGELFRNARTLQRRLNVLAEAAPPADDATLVVLEGA
ncbi:MAG: protein phosphatase 2C domain-containing protein [Myxococcota bacterium]